jgi:hypothetical protein
MYLKLKAWSLKLLICGRGVRGHFLLIISIASAFRAGNLQLRGYRGLEVGLTVLHCIIRHMSVRTICRLLWCDNKTEGMEKQLTVC